MIILGIDPGSTRIGYGAIDKSGNKLKLVDAGLLKIPEASKSEQLLALEREFQKLTRRIRPERIGVEKLFFFKNQKTAIEVAQARGVIMNAIAKGKVIPLELTPSEIKMAVTGDGRASKQAVARMVGYFIDLKGKKFIDDVTDALAVAIAISNRREGVDI
jgi:crossover junction endodeoxyribonuclease RuvC